MGTIREYTAPNADRGLQPFQPSSAGAQALAQEARRTGSLAREAGDAIGGAISGVGRQLADSANRFVTQKEELAFTSAQPEYRAQRLQNYNDFKANNDITDPAKLQEFNDSQTALDDKLLNSFSTDRGRALAQDEVRTMRDAFSRTQMADVGERTKEQGVQAVVNNVNKNAAIVQEDPTFLDLSLKSVDDMVARLKANPALSEEQRAGFDAMGRTSKANIARTAFMTMAERNPEAAKAQLDTGWKSDVISAQERDQLSRVADVYIREKRQDSLREQAEQRRQETQAVNTGFNQLNADHFDSSSGQWTDLKGYADGIKDLIKQHPNEETGLARSGFALVDRLTQEKVQKAEVGHDDPQVWQDFRSRMSLEEGDPNALSRAEIFDARANGRLSNYGLSFFENAIKADPQEKAAHAQFNTYVNSFRLSVDPSSAYGAIPTPQGRIAWGTAQVAAADAFKQAWRTGGIVGVQALMDQNDPKNIGRQFQDQGLFYNSKKALQQFQTNMTGGSISPFRSLAEHAISTGEGETPPPAAKPIISPAQRAKAPFFAAQSGMSAEEIAAAKIEPRKPGETFEAYSKRAGGK